MGIDSPSDLALAWARGAGALTAPDGRTPLSPERGQTRALRNMLENIRIISNHPDECALLSRRCGILNFSRLTPETIDTLSTRIASLDRGIIDELSPTENGTPRELCFYVLAQDDSNGALSRNDSDEFVQSTNGIVVEATGASDTASRILEVLERARATSGRDVRAKFLFLNSHASPEGFHASDGEMITADSLIGELKSRGGEDVLDRLFAEQILVASSGCEAAGTRKDAGSESNVLQELSRDLSGPDRTVVSIGAREINIDEGLHVNQAGPGELYAGMTFGGRRQKSVVYQNGEQVAEGPSGVRYADYGTEKGVYRLALPGPSGSVPIHRQVGRNSYVVLQKPQH